jgi:hypothetical protein
MNRNLLCSLLLLLTVCVPMLSWSQPKLRVTMLTSLPADTVIYPNTWGITYFATVENVGNNQLTGPCYLKTRYNTTPGDSILWSWIASNFEVGQTEVFSFTDSIRTLDVGRYKGGGNILVIWPQADNPNVQAPDTTNFPIYIRDITIDAPDPTILADRVAISPNPVVDHLRIAYLHGAQKIECVRIVGLDGKVMFQSNKAVEQIDLSALSSGLYFLEFKFKDGIYGSMRVSKP